MIESVQEPRAKQTLSYGMVGGGSGSFIGDVHRKAIAFDRSAVLKAGCFSRDSHITAETGHALELPAERLYSDPQEMAKGESARAEGIDFVVICTPNSTHFSIAKAFLHHGISVVCEKPLTFEVQEAEQL